MSTTKGFTLIELLVVVGILGIISAIGVVSYTGYVESARRSSAENTILQVTLAQTEFFSTVSTFYFTDPGQNNCVPDLASSDLIEQNLLGGSNVIGANNADFQLCIDEDANDANFYKVVATSAASACIITWTNATGNVRDPNTC